MICAACKHVLYLHSSCNATTEYYKKVGFGCLTCVSSLNVSDLVTVRWWNIRKPEAWKTPHFTFLVTLLKQNLPLCI